MRTLRPLPLLGLPTLAAVGLLAAPLPFASPSAPAPNLAEAQATTEALANAVVSAVISISDATPPGSDPAEIEAASRAVSLLAPGRWHSYRLIDATGDPLDGKNQPFGAFENQGLAQLVAGAPSVQQVIGGRLRTLLPLTNDAHPNCATCHTNYGALPPGTVVGAASFRVKL
ncbi:MAG: hypothetical protein AAGB93_19370 [Planctomycetota bacterium]